MIGMPSNSTRWVTTVGTTFSDGIMQSNGNCACSMNQPHRGRRSQSSVKTLLSCGGCREAITPSKRNSNERRAIWPAFTSMWYRCDFLVGFLMLMSSVRPLQVMEMDLMTGRSRVCKQQQAFGCKFNTPGSPSSITHQHRHRDVALAGQLFA